MAKNTQINTKTIAKYPTQGNDVTTLAANSVSTTNIQDLAVTTNKLADSSVTGPKLSADAIATVLKQNKNYLINGDHAVSQRAGTSSIVSPTSGQYLTDRFAYSRPGGTMTHTVTQDTDVPTFAQVAAGHPSALGYIFNYSLRLNLTAADTSIAAADGVGIFQRIEGYNYAQFAQKAFTLSFWVKATLPGIYCVSFNNSGDDRSYVAEYTINATNTWEFKQIQVSAPPSTGTWNYTSGVGLTINWMLACGSNLATTANSWQTGQFRCTANQVNGVNTGATDFRITGTMLNEGSVAQPFRLFASNEDEEIRACQRYCPAIRCQGSVVEYIPGSGTANGTGLQWQFLYPVETRAKPTSVVVSASSHFTFSTNAGNFVASAVSYNGSANSSFRSGQFAITIATVGTPSQGGFLYFNNATAFMYLEGAEL